MIATILRVVFLCTYVLGARGRAQDFEATADVPNNSTHRPQDDDTVSSEPKPELLARMEFHNGRGQSTEVTYAEYPAGEEPIKPPVITVTVSADASSDSSTTFESVPIRFCFTFPEGTVENPENLREKSPEEGPMNERPENWRDSQENARAPCVNVQFHITQMMSEMPMSATSKVVADKFEFYSKKNRFFGM